MLFNVIKTIVMFSVVDSVYNAATSQDTSRAAAVKRHDPIDFDGYSAARSDDYDSTTLDNGQYQQNEVGIQALVTGWASLTSAFSQFQSVLATSASVSIAIEAAVALGNRVQLISSQYDSCGCSQSSSSMSEFSSMAVQFFVNMQSALQAGKDKYGYVWETGFKSICQKFSTAFVALQAIAASITVDLAAVLRQASVNVHLFAAVGLNLSALLHLNLSLGGIF